MAAIRWLETDSASNVDISSATAIGAYTADADRVIMVDVSIDQVAGNGDYVMYCTRQIGGAGSSYVILPKTTMTAAAGETAIAGQSGWITVRNGDVVTVYVDGLAGDTTTPDYITRWFEDAAIRPTTADRTADVSAGGEVGIDWANIGSPTTAVNLSGTTTKDLSASGANDIADALLKRDWTSVSGEAARSVLNALRFLRNKWVVSGNTLSVKEEDDVTEAWNATVTSDPTADPIIGSDPT